MLLTEVCAHNLRISRGDDRMPQFNSRSILSLHRGPKRLIAHITMLLAIAISPRIVNSQPFPIASMRGCAMIPPTHEKIFRMKLFVATPDDDFRGINSVNMVVAMPKTSIEPTPKKKLAMS